MKRPPITAAHKKTFLEQLEEGHPRPQAARAAHPDLTGMRFKSLANRDPKFKAAIEAAERIGLDARSDRIRGEMENRAFNPAAAGSTRILELLAATYVPDFQWLRKKGTPDHDGDGEQLLPMVNTELLTPGQLARLADLRDEMIDLIEMGQGKKPNPDLEPAQLPPANTNGAP